jgi:heme/copper-type cytochrome/quinol oxidase subunit 3
MTYSDGVQSELLSLRYSTHLRSSDVMIQLTHSMLPLSLLILGCYTCSIYRWSLDTSGLSIATMSRDNGSEICNIECTSTSTQCIIHVKSSYASSLGAASMDEAWCVDVDVSGKSLVSSMSNDICNIDCNPTLVSLVSDLPEDLYSHQYGSSLGVTIKTISNMVKITKNMIIPLINGTGTLFPVMIIFCIRDSLREYKSNYVILNSLQMSFYNWFILSESAIFIVVFWSSLEHILSPLYITINLWIVNMQLNSYDLSLKNTNLLSTSAIIFGYHSIIGTCIFLIQCHLLSIVFEEGQMSEFCKLCNNLSDTLLGCILYNIDGCHLFHIVIGNLFVCIIVCCLCICYYLCFHYVFRVVILMLLYVYQIVYWHFVELFWLFLYYVVYC